LASIDFLPTFATLTGFAVPRDRIIDGVDQSELWLGKNPQGNRTQFHYFSQNELHAVREGPWKLLLPNRHVFYAYVKDRGTAEVELYNLDRDLGETTNVAAQNPAVVERLAGLAKSFQWPEQLLPAGIGLPNAAGPNPAPAGKAKGKGKSVAPERN
jgi:arylsulfatase A-like enzyme